MDLSLVNNSHLTRITFSAVCKTVHNSVLIYFRTSQPSGHSLLFVQSPWKLDVSRDSRSLFYNGRCVPWGRRQWVGINCCHHEVAKLQQQCHMQNTIFDLPWQLVLFNFSGRGREPISCRQQQENWEKKWKWQSSEKVKMTTQWESENDNPVRKWKWQSSEKVKMTTQWESENDNPVRKWKWQSSEKVAYVLQSLYCLLF